MKNTFKKPALSKVIYRFGWASLIWAVILPAIYFNNSASTPLFAFLMLEVLFIGGGINMIVKNKK